MGGEAAGGGAQDSTSDNTRPRAHPPATHTHSSHDHSHAHNTHTPIQPTIHSSNHPSTQAHQHPMHPMHTMHTMQTTHAHHAHHAHMHTMHTMHTTHAHMHTMHTMHPHSSSSNSPCPWTACGNAGARPEGAWRQPPPQPHRNCVVVCLPQPLHQHQHLALLPPRLHPPPCLQHQALPPCLQPQARLHRPRSWCLHPPPPAPRLAHTWHAPAWTQPGRGQWWWWWWGRGQWSGGGEGLGVNQIGSTTVGGPGQPRGGRAASAATGTALHHVPLARIHKGPTSGQASTEHRRGLMEGGGHGEGGGITGEGNNWFRNPPLPPQKQKTNQTT